MTLLNRSIGSIDSIRSINSVHSIPSIHSIHSIKSLCMYYVLYTSLDPLHSQSVSQGVSQICTSRGGHL